MREKEGWQRSRQGYICPHERGQGESLTIYGDPVCEGDGTFGKVMYLYVCYCLCFFEETSLHTSEEQVMEERDLDL